MNFPNHLLYSRSHEWLELKGTNGTVGLTEYAVSELGDLVFVNLPSVGDAVTAGETMGDVESVKAVSDVFCPVTGVVSGINEALLDAPQLLNESPYEAWLVQVEEITDKEPLLSAQEYEAFLATLEA